MSASVQCRIGWMRRCAPGGGEALKWSQNSGGWSRTSHPPSRPRGENTRSLARVASSSRRMPAINPSKPYLVERELQPFGLARGGARGRRQGRIDGIDRRAGLDLEVELPFLAVAIAERIHLRKFLAGVDMQRRERHAAEERLARQPDHHVGILAERPQQRELLQPREGFAQNVDALRLELVEMVHRGRRQPSDRPEILRHGMMLR